MSSFERGGGGDRRYLSVAASDSGTAQLMVAMQPGVDLSTVDVQEVVVVTDRDRRFRSPSVVARRNRRSCCYDDDEDEEEDNADMHTRGEDEIIECDYETSEAVAAEIEVVDGRIGGLEGLLGTKARRGRLKRRRGRFAKKSPPSKAIRTTTTKTMSRKRIVESSPDFGESDSDAVDEAGYGRSLLKRRKRNFAHRLQWRDADMQDAMLAVREKNATIRGAAKQFDVPYSTLKDRVRNRVKHGTKPGMKTALSPEDEEELVRCIQQMVSAGFHMQGIDIREHAHDFRNRNKHCSANSKHRSAVPGHNWLAGFLKRHPSIELSRSVNRPALPSVSKQKHMLRRFFDVTSAAYQKLSRPLQAAQLYTMSELKLGSFPHTSLFLTASANGTILPPYVLFSGSRILMPRLQQHFPAATFSVYLNPGQRKDVLLSWFRDHFLPHVQQNGTGRPVVLFIAQLACNISVHFVSLANDRRVSLVCMPTGILHLVQPLDDVVLHKIDELVTKCGQRYLEDRKTPSVDQIGMAEILQKVWQRGVLPSREVALNFKENGLFPFNMRAVTHERIATSMPLVNVEKDGEVSSDDETDGLALLSELSSLDQNVGETKNVNFCQKRARNDTAEISPYKRHKLSPENSCYDADNFEQKISIETQYSVTPQFSQEPMKHVLTDERKAGACSRMRPVRRASHRPHRNAHQEVQTSRQKPEQSDLPIKGIFDKNSSSISTHCISSSLCNSTGNNASKTCKNVSSNSISRSTDDSTSNFVTLTPVYRILEISPNIKQEYISYVEDPHEEFVPQEIVEGQTVVQDCMTYEMPLNAFCKEEVIEEVIDLPQFILSADDDVNPEGIKVENVNEEFFNNNELSYDLQTEEVSNVTGNGCLVGPVVKAFNIIPDSGSKSSLDDADETTTYIEVNGCSYPVVQTLSIQEFRKTFGIVSQAAGLLLGNGSEDIKDEN